MGVFLIILGLALGLFGACNLVQAIGDANAARQVGSITVGLVLALPGVAILIYGIKRGPAEGTERQHAEVSALRGDDQAGRQGLPALPARRPRGRSDESVGVSHNAMQFAKSGP